MVRVGASSAPIGDVDHGPVGSFGQRSGESLGEEHRAGEGEANARLPVAQRHFLEGVGGKPGGAVDEDANIAERPGRGIDQQASGGSRIGEIG